MRQEELDMTARLDILNLAIGFAGFILCCLGILAALFGTKADRHTERYFLMSYLTLLLFTAANIAGLLMRGRPGSIFHGALLVSNFIEFLSPVILAYIITVYLLSIVDPGHTRLIMRVLFPALLLGHLILLIISQFTGLYYIIDAGNYYHRSEAYALSYLLPLVIIAADLYLLVHDRKLLTKKERFAFTLYFVIPAAAIIVQLFIYGIYVILFATIVGALVMYIFIISDQTDRYYRQVEENAGLQMEIMLSQIRPHFIFNTLGAIRRLCQNAPEAQVALSRFSVYLRGNMDSLSHREPIPFSSELEHTRAYLDLERLRFGSELTVEYDLGCTEFLLPTLSLQPLVENAVCHGIRAKEDGTGTVRISTREYAGHYEITVFDDGVGFDPSRVPEDGRSHIGVENVRERVRRLCGGEVQIDSAPGNGCRAAIILPKEWHHADIRN